MQAQLLRLISVFIPWCDEATFSTLQREIFRPSQVSIIPNMGKKKNRKNKNQLDLGENPWSESVSVTVVDDASKVTPIQVR